MIKTNAFGLHDFDNERKKIKDALKKPVKTGYGTVYAFFFIMMRTIGVGMFILPKVMGLVGWPGYFIIFFANVWGTYGAHQLSRSWDIVCDRYPQDVLLCSDPYVEIGTKAFGGFGKLLLLILLYGHSMLVFIVLTLFMAGLLEELLQGLMPFVSICIGILVIAAILIPTMWYPTLRSFKNLAVLVVILSICSVILMTTQMILDREDRVFHATPYFMPFVRSISGVVLAYDAAPSLLNIKVDMKEPLRFSKSIGWSYFITYIIHVYLATIGFLFQGMSASYNSFESLTLTPIAITAISFKLISIFGVTYLVLFPVMTSIENFLRIPETFNLKLITSRTILTLVLAFLSLAFPNFGTISFMVGGSTVMLLNFILPQSIFLILASKKSENWTDYKLHWYEVAINIILIIMGLLIMILSVIAAIFNIVYEGFELRASCLANFY